MRSWAVCSENCWILKPRPSPVKSKSRNKVYRNRSKRKETDQNRPYRAQPHYFYLRPSLPWRAADRCPVRVQQPATYRGLYLLLLSKLVEKGLRVTFESTPLYQQEYFSFTNKEYLRGRILSKVVLTIFGCEGGVWRKQKKSVYHDYGHGGAGISIAYGCAKNVVERLFLEEKVPLDREIAVLGCGIVGLSTAFLLL